MGESGEVEGMRAGFVDLSGCAREGGEGCFEVTEEGVDVFLTFLWG